MPTDWTRRCPVCDAPVWHNHRCRGTETRYPALEGEEALAAVREVKAALHTARHPSHVPDDPIQTRMDFGSEGL